MSEVSVEVEEPKTSATSNKNASIWEKIRSWGKKTGSSLTNIDQGAAAAAFDRGGMGSIAQNAVEKATNQAPIQPSAPTLQK